MIEIYSRNENFDREAIREYNIVKHYEVQEVKREFIRDEIQAEKKFENDILKLDLIW